MDDKSLVENEGVNAGSAQQLQEPDVPAAAHDKADVRSGGKPQEAGRHAPVEDMDDENGDSELLGAPDQRSRYPGQPDGSAGQDAGSMD